MWAFGEVGVSAIKSGVVHLRSISSDLIVVSRIVQLFLLKRLLAVQTLPTTLSTRPPPLRCLPFVTRNRTAVSRFTHIS